MPTGPSKTVYSGVQMPDVLQPWLNAAHGLDWKTGVCAVGALQSMAETVRGNGLLAESVREFQIDYATNQVNLRLDGRLLAQIDPQGAEIALSDIAGAGLDRLLGPPLVLALAMRGIYCLHASAAIAPDGTAVAFSAISGTGKSTLARVAAANGWLRLGDDLCPLAAGPEILPRFPQLKLGPHTELLPAQVALDQIVFLSRGPRAALQRMSTAELAKALLAASVGAKMYSAAMRQAHFLWATSLANHLGQGAAWQLTLPESPHDPTAAALSALTQLRRGWQ